MPLKDDPVAVDPSAKAGQVDGVQAEVSAGLEHRRLRRQVEDAEDRGALEPPDEGQRFGRLRGRVFQERDVAFDQGRVLPPEAEQAAVVGENGGIVRALLVHGAAEVGRRYGQPGAACCETRLRRAAFPDHRRPAAVAAFELRPQAQAIGVHQILVGQFGFVQPQFLALVQADGASHRQQESRGQFGKLLLVLGMLRHRLTWRTTSWLEKAQQGQPSAATSSKREIWERK